MNEKALHLVTITIILNIYSKKYPLYIRITMFKCTMKMPLKDREGRRKQLKSRFRFHLFKSFWF
jgi:hypothetical protein